MCIYNVPRLVNDEDSTWRSQVSGLRKELLLSLPKAQLTNSSSRTGLTISSMLPSYSICSPSLVTCNMLSPKVH